MINYIESKDNPKIKNALKIATDASFRKKNGMFFASSSKAVGDIARAGFEPVALFLTGEEYEGQGEKFAAYPVYVISSSVCEKLREGKTEDGVFGVFKMKPGDTDEILSGDKLLVLQDVQDPGNMGAIMRTALAFGFKNAVVTTGCADVYSRKVIRSSMTACVKMNIYKTDDLLQFTKKLNEKGFCTVASCLEGAQELGNAKIKRPVALYIGNEGNGLPKEIINRCAVRVKIPMSGEIESLNAAVSAAVLMWELGRC